MRSARTDRLARRADLRPSPAPPAATGAPIDAAWHGPARRHFAMAAARLLLGLALLATLAACADGSAQEARRGQARDAAADPNLPKAQATRTVERFFPTQPPPKPTPPPPPTVETLVMTLALGGDGAPQGNYSHVPADAGTAYAAALVHGASEGQEIAARFLDATGLTVATSKLEIEADADALWVGLPLTLNGAIVPGEYAVYVFAGERRINSLHFVVGPPGSGGQLMSDLPANPRADRGGPNEPPPGQGGRQTPGAGGQPGQPGQQTPFPGQTVPGQPVAPTPYPGQVPAGQIPVGQEPAPVVTDPGAVAPDQGATGEWVPTQTP